MGRVVPSLLASKFRTIDSSQLIDWYGVNTSDPQIGYCAIEIRVSDFPEEIHIFNDEEFKYEN